MYFKSALKSGWLTAIRYGMVTRRSRRMVQKHQRARRFPPGSTRYETTTHIIKGVPTQVKILLIRAGTPWPEVYWGGPRLKKPEQELQDADIFPTP